MSKTVRKEQLELLAMFHFANYISKRSGLLHGLPNPYDYLNKVGWGTMNRDYYGMAVATYLDNMSQSAQFSDWVKSWEIEPENTSKNNHYSTTDWRVLISRWAED